MATYKHLRSSTANKRPTTSIADGQLAINSNAASAGLFFKDSTGATIIKVGPVHVGTTAPNATPGAGGSSGNSTGEVWLDTSLTPVGVKIWNGSAWVNGTPIGSTTVQGLLELATDVETQAGSDTARAVTPSSLQSKVSDSTSTTSSTTIASSTAVKSAFDLANAALPKSGGTVTGNLEIGTTGSLTFEGSVADGFETTIAVTNPTADRTITLPDQTGNMLVSGNASIVNADVSAAAAIAGTKISPDFGSQTVTTTGTSTAASFIPTSSTVPTNGVYLPAANSVAISTGGSGRLFIAANGNIGVGTASPVTQFHIQKATDGLAGIQISTSAYGSTIGDGLFVGIDNDFAYLYNYENKALTFGTNALERMRITSAGLVGVGTSSPGARLSVLSADNVAATTIADFGANNGTSAIQLGYNRITQVNSAPASAYLQLGVSNKTDAIHIDGSGRVGIGTTNPGTPLHVLGFTTSIIAEGSAQGTVEIRKQGTNGISLTSDAAGKLTFYDNNAATTRATIDSSGRLLIGTTNPYSSRLIVKGENTSNSEFACRFHDSADLVLFYVRNDGYIQTGTGVNSPYNLTTASAANLRVEVNGELRRSTSSAKYKTKINNAEHGLTELLQLRSVTYKGVNDGDKIFGGLIAEEVHSAGLSEFVQYAEDGSPDALNYGNMVSLCIKAIQEQQVMIAELQAKVASLEAS